jgi:hypothetical protein
MVVDEVAPKSGRCWKASANRHPRAGAFRCNYERYLKMINVKGALIGSTVVFLALGLAQDANAQTYEGDEQSNYCINNPGKCGAEREYKKPRTDEGYSDDQEVYSKKRKYQENDQAEDQTDQPRMKHAEGDWKYDPSRHKRRRHKDDEFRFYFGGFWYPQPYWQVGIGNPYRIGCAEGRSILRDRGFYRVRALECNGRTYTYVGRRHGDTFRVLLSSRSGRIVDVSPL